MRIKYENLLIYPHGSNTQDPCEWRKNVFSGWLMSNSSETKYNSSPPPVSTGEKYGDATRQECHISLRRDKMGQFYLVGREGVTQLAKISHAVGMTLLFSAKRGVI